MQSYFGATPPPDYDIVTGASSVSANRIPDWLLAAANNNTTVLPVEPLGVVPRSHVDREGDRPPGHQIASSTIVAQPHLDMHRPPPSYNDPNLSPVSPNVPPLGQLSQVYNFTGLQSPQSTTGWVYPNAFVPPSSVLGNAQSSQPAEGSWDGPKFAYCATRRQEEFNRLYDGLYPFQKEIFCRCMRQSSIIFLPTGAGKTVIAAALSSYKVTLQPSKKIIFVVNRIPLVSQQANVLGRFGLRVAQVCGDKKDASSWSTFMEDGFEALVIIDALLIEFIAKHTTALFDDCSMLVFDEVHHARKSSNYSKLLQMMDRTDRPMVLGLSASPSARENAAKTREALEDLMGVSRCYVVCVLTEVEDLKQRVAVPETDVILFHPSVIEKAIDELIKVALRSFEDGFVEKVKRLLPHAVYPFEGCHGFPFGSPQYIDKARQANLVFQQDGLAACAAVAEHIGALNQALILLEESSPREASQFLLNHPTTQNIFPATFEGVAARMQDRYLGDIDTVRTELCIYHFAHECSLPLYVGLSRMNSVLLDPANGCDMSTKMKELMGALQDIVDEEYKVDQLNSFRGIVFCETKAATVQIVERLKNTSEQLGKILRPAFFVGHGRTLVPQLGGMTIGMSDNQQQRTLRAFREGDIKLLVATSVAEEGLDIPMCNVVIRYEGVFSVQSFIQSRGRARKRNSQFLVISKDVPANPLRDVLRDCRVQSTVVREVALSDQEAIIAANETKADGPLRIFEADPQKFLKQVEFDHGVQLFHEERSCRGGMETSLTATLPDGTTLRGVGLGNPQRSAQEARLQIVQQLYLRGYIRNDTVISSQSLTGLREVPKYRYFKNPNVAVSNTRGVATSNTGDPPQAEIGSGSLPVTVFNEDHWGPYLKPLLLLDKHLRERGFEPPRPVLCPRSDTDGPDVITAAVEFQMRAPGGGSDIKWYSCSQKGTTWEIAMQGAAMEVLRALGHNVVLRPHSHAANKS